MLRFLSVLFFCICFTIPAKAEVRLTISYSETADLFQTMDNVSLWLDGFTDPRYRKDWEERFGWSAEDEQWAKRYADYRARTFSDPSQNLDVATSPQGLFVSSVSNAASADPLADYLLSKPDIAAALRDLEMVMSQQDARMLRGFFAHFEPKWRALLSDREPLIALADQLRARMDDATLSPFIKRIGAFYGADAKGEFRVFFTRFPPGNGSSANIMSGNALVLNSPVEMTLEEGEWDTIVAHEFAHFLSSQQPDAQKRRLTDRFLGICTVPEKASRLWMIEEPLAVAVGQVAYSELVLGKPLDPLSNWYFVPWIDVTARTLAPSVMTSLRSGQTLEESSIIEEAAKRCHDLKAITKQIGSPGG